MKTSRQKANEQYENAPPIHCPQPPLTWQPIYQLVRDIYFGRGGVEGMTLNDWRLAEQELNRKLTGETHPGRTQLQPAAKKP